VWLLAVLLGLGATAVALAKGNGTMNRHQELVTAARIDEPVVGTSVQTGTGDGSSLGRIEIPALGLNVALVQGVDLETLAGGAGHYPATPAPCAPGNVAVAGYRTTFDRPFYGLNELSPGDIVQFQSSTLRCEYLVSRSPFVVSRSDPSVVVDTPGLDTLTMTTSAPTGSATQRLVVRAEMLPGSLRLASEAKSTLAPTDSAS
jgi:LPXTG-site transpeptidase (sortase) family protein